MRYRTERRRSGMGCLAWLVVIVWLALGGVLLYRYYVQPRISEYIGQQIGARIERPTSSPQNQIEGQVGGLLPTVVAALPTGTLRVSEGRVNQYLAEHPEALQPIESATVRFVPGEVQAELRLLSTTSLARMGLVAQNGRLVTTNARIEGPLGQLISLSDLTRVLERQLNEQLEAQGRRITDVQIEQGELVLRVES